MGHTYKCREAELVPVPRYCLRMVEKIGTCHAGEVSIHNISTVHTQPMYIVCPVSLSMVGETSYRIWVGLIKSDTVIIILFYFLVIYILSTKSALVQLINCQLFDLLLSLHLKSYMLETNSHYTPELLICAPGDLTMSDPAYTACLHECEYQNLFGQYRNFFYLFVFCLGSKFACIRLVPFTLVTL